LKIQFFRNPPLVISILVAMASVAVDAPPWISLFSVVLIGYKLVSEKTQMKPISRKLTAFLAVLLLLEVLLQFRSLLNQEASTTLILGLTSLKIMDYETERDLKFLFLLGLILVALKPLYSIDIYWLGPILLCFGGLWWSVLNLQLKYPLRFILKLFLSAMPMTLALFIIFPRVVMPWAQTKSAETGFVGFSDSLNPGEVASLVETRALAFRARFTDHLDFRTKTLYWRGAVLTRPQGLSWLPPKSIDLGTAQDIPTNSLHYEVLLEPNSRPFLFTLDRTLFIKTDSLSATRDRNNVFRASHNILSPTFYDGFLNILSADVQSPSREQSEIPTLSKRAQAWVDRVKVQERSVEQRLNALKDLFSDGSFVYTLNPGAYGENDLDEFLFVKRRGFCEHYAGAYGSLARALGIPSRVIVGFQGGEYNKFGEFWRVTTRDAHAWVELFVEHRWQRVDPTTWVAPLRFELGANAFFDLSEEDQRLPADRIFQRQEPPLLRIWYDQIIGTVETANYRWTNFLMNYDRKSQKDLLSDLKANLGWVFLALACLVITISFLRFLLTPKSSPQKAFAIIFYELFEWGQKKNIPRLPDDTPLAYIDKLRSLDLDLEPFLIRLQKSYEEATYQERQESNATSKSLLREWRASRPQ
jgi:transglutaminase-like putative cysteine protease